MNSDNHPLDKDLQEIRTEIRSYNDGDSSKEIELINQLMASFQELSDIPNITERKIRHVGKLLFDTRNYRHLISPIFPYALYVQIIEQCPTERIGVFALKQLSLFARYSSFPFKEIKDGHLDTFLNIFLQSTDEVTLSATINIFLYFLKHFPDFRDVLIEKGALEVCATRPFSARMPNLILQMILITPTLPNEIIYQIAQIFSMYISFFDKNDNLAQLIASNTIDALGSLLEVGFSPFDFSILNDFMEQFLESQNEKIVCSTIKIIMNLPTPTIQYAQKCLDRMASFQNYNIINLLLKLFIKKSDEWCGFHIDQQLIELCLHYSSSDEIGFDDSLLCLRVLFNYYPFSQTYDGRMVDLLLKFLTTPSTSSECLKRLNDLFSSEFEGNEKFEFATKIEESYDDFQAVIDEDEDCSLLASEFLNRFEEWKSHIAE
ncbi:hypothetical protein TRFO_08652 [Tritrichomonas foetus]|uniref:Uncharacterized protein n=1 Tax=Tritrichomonas foetus TaxID=1144522 RepID=A0A1J4JP77_9EUKA|nr:hypothetical protein TRFO_08652 [Tritrichomonas foetus]|eukprot:OHS99076.1 hypothetical protein TRFO_08652 [Tritrichomonas foetus]